MYYLPMARSKNSGVKSIETFKISAHVGTLQSSSTIFRDRLSFSERLISRVN